MDSISKSIIFQVNEESRVVERAITYFNDFGFKCTKRSDQLISFSKGSILKNLLAFNPLEWKSNIDLEVNDKEVRIDLKINTFGQIVLKEEEVLWDLFIDNFKLFIIDGKEYNKIKIINEKIRDVKKESYNFLEGWIIGGTTSVMSYKFNKKWKWTVKLISPILAIYMYYLLYSGAIDALTYDKVGVWGVALIILLGIPCALYLTIRLWLKFDSRRLLALVFASLSILINGPFYAHWLGRHESEVYRNSGQQTKAIVTKSFFDYKQGNRMYYEFIVDGIHYESFNVVNDNGHVVGDTIEIIYNKTNPKMNQALETTEN